MPSVSKFFGAEHNSDNWQATISILRQQKDWVVGGRKMASFANVQYFIYADIVGGSENVQKYVDVI